MTVDELDTALAALGWKVSDFCRATGLHRNTPSRWRTDGVEIPAWVPKHLGLLLELQRLHAAYLTPPKFADVGSE
nr:helix-turn-helix transcriptional regulator [uncultured Albidiferax sp.]